MGYEISLNMAWEEMQKLAFPQNAPYPFLLILMR